MDHFAPVYIHVDFKFAIENIFRFGGTLYVNFFVYIHVLLPENLRAHLQLSV
jgi:hypothetical protein